MVILESFVLNTVKHQILPFLWMFTEGPFEKHDISIKVNFQMQVMKNLKNHLISRRTFLNVLICCLILLADKFNSVPSVVFSNTPIANEMDDSKTERQSLFCVVNCLI